MFSFFQRNIYPFIDFKIPKPLVVTEIFQGIPQNNIKLRSNTYDTIEVSTMKLFRYVKPQGVIRAHQKILRLPSRLTPTLKFFMQENLDTEWKFTRTKIWLSWIYKKGVLPPPFNILYVLLPVHWLIKHLLAACLPVHFVSNSLCMYRDI